MNNYFSNRFSPDQAGIRIILSRRLAGIILFGFVPTVLIFIFLSKNLSGYGLHGTNLKKSFLWFLPSLALILPLNYFGSKSSYNLEMYPQIRVSEWSISLLIVSALSWILYLFAYEFMFRGFLLFSCVSCFNTWTAIAINTSIYALVHVPKGIGEAVGSIPFGIVLCWLVLSLGSVWIALFIHITLALSNEWFSLSAHPEMKLNFHKSNQ